MATESMPTDDLLRDQDETGAPTGADVAGADEQTGLQRSSGGYDYYGEYGNTSGMGNYDGGIGNTGSNSDY